MSPIEADVRLYAIEAADGSERTVGIDRNRLQAGVINAGDSGVKSEVHLLSAAIADPGRAAREHRRSEIASSGLRHRAGGQTAYKPDQSFLQAFVSPILIWKGHF